MKRNLLTATVIIASLGMVAGAEAAGDIEAGKARAAACAACHGADGKGVAPNPALAGKPEAEQVKALQDYKSGARANPIMKGMASSLSDKDMEDVAAYYASLK
jgi:cytochrome c553